MKTILVLVVPAIFLLGCSSSHVVSLHGGADSISYLEFNDKMKDYRVWIQLTDGRTWVGDKIELNQDSARWTDVKSDSSVGMGANQILTVVRNDHWSAALNWAGSGAAGGVTVGYALASKDSSDWGRLGAAALFGVTGGIVGGLLGLIVGQSDAYHFVAGTDSTKK